MLLIILVAVAAVILIGTVLFLNSKPFGKAPNGERLKRFESVTHYSQGIFHNLEETPVMADDVSYPAMIYQFFFQSSNRKSPASALPSIKTNIKSLPTTEDCLVWFGHSSYYMQIDGIRILVDPVFSGKASPIPGSIKAFPGTDIYIVDDMPKIDLLLITHDHYDHLDFETILELNPKVNRVVTSLGCGSHLEYWGYNPAIITELNWDESTTIAEKLKITALPARHFGGRGLTRANTFWSAFLLESDSLKILAGGDSGYGDHFKAIGDLHPGIDLAILENGQYDLKWPFIHMQPEEVIQAAEDLGVKQLFPVHNSKFPLANHEWDEPLKRISALSVKSNIRLATPKIGELLRLGGEGQEFSEWWKGID